MIVLHDTYFYWTHRFMHLKRVYPIVHRVHHVSINPSPWAAYSGHPLEAAIAAGIFPLIAFLIPAHWTAMAIYLFYMLFMSVMGHAGFEFYPKNFLRTWVGRWQTTATHHNLHHQFFNGNYGIYFSFWDRVMKTEQKGYTKRFEEIADRDKQ
jgi:sterol desaturase/sphingolipid hydroxylase (fatty acid hydroxylase superfamily)